MKKRTQEEEAALTLLRSTGAPLLAAAVLAWELLSETKGDVTRARACAKTGLEQVRAAEQSVSFGHAVSATLEQKSECRPRTRADFRYLMQRLLRRNPQLKKRRVNRITPEECRACIETAFATPQQRLKARRALSSVFSTCRQQGWCRDNPASRLKPERIREKPIGILSPEEIGALLQAAREYRDKSCLAAVGLMLYAGLRPHETARLSWHQVDLTHNYISVQPQHSKTGGARRVSIHPALRRLLVECCPEQPGQQICPPDWPRHWRKLHRLAGWDPARHPWPADVLRHTYASYHLQHFRSYSLLQCELGHRSTALLRTRYVDTSGVTDTAGFFAGTMPPHEQPDKTMPPPTHT